MSGSPRAAEGPTVYGRAAATLARVPRRCDSAAPAAGTYCRPRAFGAGVVPSIAVHTASECGVWPKDIAFWNWVAEYR